MAEFVAAQPLHVEQGDGAALPLRQISHCLFEGTALLVGDQALDRLRIARSHLAGLLDRLMRPPSRPVEGQIEHDPIKPGGEPRDLGIERRRVAPDPQERILADVVGLGGIANDALRDPNCAPHVAAHQNAEGLRLTRGYGRHQRLVRQVFRHACPCSPFPRDQATTTTDRAPRGISRDAMHP